MLRACIFSACESRCESFSVVHRRKRHTIEYQNLFTDLRWLLPIQHGIRRQSSFHTFCRTNQGRGPHSQIFWPENALRMLIGLVAFRASYHRFPACARKDRQPRATATAIDHYLQLYKIHSRALINRAIRTHGFQAVRESDRIAVETCRSKRTRPRQKQPK